MMIQMIPTPKSLGLPKKFQEWRGTQDQAIDSIYRMVGDRDRRFLAQAQPTGSGKSLSYVAAHVWANIGRTVILTSTKALQSQLMRDFESIGMVEIKGKNSYQCRIDRKRRADKAPCSFGQLCRYARGSSGCAYYDALNKAKASRLVVTNYAYWITTRLHRDPSKVEEGLTRPFLLVLDEAHAAPDHLTDSLTFKLTAKEAGALIGMELPESMRSVPDWVRKAKYKAEKKYEDMVPEVRESLLVADEVSEYRGLINKLTWLERAAQESQDWMINIQCGEAGYSPVWPKNYAEKYLFDACRKVLFVSATVRPKTVEMLGLKPKLEEGGWVSPTTKGEALRAQIEDKGGGEICAFEEFPSTFPVANRVLYHVPTVRLSHRTGPEEMRLWLARIDQIIRPRIGMKGIIHTVSYERCRIVVEGSDYRKQMLTHRRDNLAQVVDRFRDSDPPCILVSPSVVTGYDFPDDQCRWQIIGKIGFPDMRDPILKARSKMDPDYVHYLAMQSLVQACGRGTRSAEDWCQNFIIDDNVKWFLYRYGHFAPEWFRESFKKVDFVPQERKEGYA